MYRRCLEVGTHIVLSLGSASFHRRRSGESYPLFRRRQHGLITEQVTAEIRRLLTFLSEAFPLFSGVLYIRSAGYGLFVGHFVPITLFEREHDHIFDNVLDHSTNS